MAFKKIIIVIIFKCSRRIINYLMSSCGNISRSSYARYDRKFTTYNEPQCAVYESWDRMSFTDLLCRLYNTAVERDCDTTVQETTGLPRSDNSFTGVLCWYYTAVVAVIDGSVGWRRDNVWHRVSSTTTAIKRLLIAGQRPCERDAIRSWWRLLGQCNRCATPRDVNVRLR